MWYSVRTRIPIQYKKPKLLHVENFIIPVLPYLRMVLWIVLCMLCAGIAYSQRIRKIPSRHHQLQGNEFRMNDTTSFFLHIKEGACKNNLLAFQLKSLARPAQLPFSRQKNGSFPAHGDLTYDFFYRSAVDTPFAGNNIQQHTLRANISLLLAGKLPVMLQLNSRRTNSPFFKNYNDVNVQFDERYYNDLMKARILENMLMNMRQKYTDSVLLQAVRNQEQAVVKQGQWLQDAHQLQQLVNSRDVLLKPDSPALIRQLPSVPDRSILSNPAAKYKLPAIPKIDSYTGRFQKNLSSNAVNEYITKDTAYLLQKARDSSEQVRHRATLFIAEYKKREAQYEAAQKKLIALKEQYSTAKGRLDAKIDSVKQVFANGSKKEINNTVKKYGQDTGNVYKWYKHLSSIEHFSIGRSMVDYSELSAKNISINGVQAVYRDRYSISFASGGVDYLYRDFLIRNVSTVKQYLNLVQLGKGEPRGNNVFLTFYQGKKQGNAYDANAQPVMNRVFGVTVGGKFRVDDNNYLLAEVAKSSYPAPVLSGPVNSSPKAFSFANHSNEAYTVQLYSRIPITDTRVYGLYRKLGRNFQSFSIFNANIDLVSWQLKVDQYFLRKQLLVSGALRTNDYSNPYIVNNFKTNTIFKSLQATLRRKKWPMLSVAYMPSSQMTSIGSQVMENRFYTLLGTANYVYRLRKTLMHTGLVYTRFYNGASDSAFVYYNARNWFVYHNIIGDVLSFNSAASISYHTGYRLLTLDQGLSCKISNRVNAGGGLKWNVLNGTDSHPGYYGNIRWRPGKLGELNMSFDRGYIPGTTDKLRKNDFGRLTYTKIF